MHPVERSNLRLQEATLMGNILQDDKRVAVGPSREGSRQHSGRTQRSYELRKESKATGSRRESKAAVGRSKNGGKLTQSCPTTVTVGLGLLPTLPQHETIGGGFTTAA